MLRDSKKYLPHNLQKRKSCGIYYARLYVGDRWKVALRRTEIVLSLKTGTRKVAEHRLGHIKSIYYRAIAMCGSCPHLSDEACFALARRYLDHALDEARRTFVGITPEGWGELFGEPFDRNTALGAAADFESIAEGLSRDALVNNLASASTHMQHALRKFGHSLNPGSDEWNLLAHYVIRVAKEQSGTTDRARSW